MSSLHLLAVLVNFAALFSALFMTVSGVSLVWLAFREGGVGEGLLAVLCILYGAYFGLTRSRHRRRHVLVVGWATSLLLTLALALASGVVRQLAGPMPRVPGTAAPAAASGAPIYPPK